VDDGDVLADISTGYSIFLLGETGTQERPGVTWGFSLGFFWGDVCIYRARRVIDLATVNK